MGGGGSTRLRFTSATRVLLALLPWRISPAPDLVHPQSRHRQRRHFGPDDQTGSRTLFCPRSTKLPGVTSKHPTLSAFPLPGMPEICRRDRWRGNRNEGRESEGSWSFSFDSECHAMSTMLTRFYNLGLESAMWMGNSDVRNGPHLEMTGSVAL
jgi:hypothetical protein